MTIFAEQNRTHIMTETKNTTTEAELYTSYLKEWQNEPSVINDGMIILCRKGTTSIRIDFVDWQLHPGAVITIFPGDVVLLYNTSFDFEVEVLRFSKELLREASLQLEQTVYRLLRADRCRKDRPVITTIIDSMFSLLKVYFKQHDCTCLDQLVLYQLKAFFLGFYDWICHNSDEAPQLVGSQRIHDHYSRFMIELETHYKQWREVKDYATCLNISPKYLNIIVRRVTQHTAKEIIDQYVVLQLKLALRTSTKPVQQLAWEYNFCDESFMCRYFKRHTGISPHRFRLAHLEMTALNL